MKKQNVFKRTVSIFLVFVVMVLMIPLSALPAAAIWNGEADWDFAGGSGTEDDPYIIRTAEQLAYFAEYVNNGYSYSGEYFKLGADIYLNNASFSLNLDSGLAIVSYYYYGYRTAYLGTGILGDASGSNTTFDTTASTAGTWYSSPNSTATTTFSGTLNAWTPIGNSSNSFEGNFDGDGHTVYGLYIETDRDQDYQGLFGYVENNATISNLGVEDSYIRAGEYVGGVVGYVRAYGEGISSTVENCYHKGVINGYYQVGGVVGYCSATDDNYSTASVTVKNCYNTGTVYSSGGSAGGVVGKNVYNGIVEECYNAGTIFGKDYIGGVVGFNDAFSEGKGTPTARNCYNTGTVKGVYTDNTYKYSEDTGGIVGRNENGVVDNCYNTGNVSGYDSVGGVVGDNMIGSLVLNSYNQGKIIGFEQYIGGVVGSSGGAITNCYNTGNVSLSGEFSNDISDYSDYDGFVGGVVGLLQSNSWGNYTSMIENCYNAASVTGSIRVGGVIGGTNGGGEEHTINKCYNVGAVDGKFYVGGVAGNFGSYGAKLENCYNAGAVNGNSYVGGIIGLQDYYGKPKNCYNVGTVTGSANIDAITASSDCTNVYYLDTCVLAESLCGAALTDAQMRYSSSFAGFDFDTVWEIGEACRYNYPTLKGVAIANDEHEYDDSCDDTCNYCGYERTAPHNRNSEDADCEISACMDCGAEMPAIAEHVRNSEYADCVVAPCTVCGADVGATAEHYVNVPTTETVSAISLQNSATYPFTESNGRYTSSNKSHSSSSTFTITVLCDGSVTIKYGVSSESNYDWLTIYKNNSQLDRISGTVSDKTLTIDLLTGETIQITYSKDGSSSSGSDSGYFEIVSTPTVEAPAIEQVPAASQTATCANPVICDGCGVTVKEGHDYSTKWTVDEEATCDTDGSKSHHCTICGGKTDVTVIPALGHTEVTDAAVAPTCTETGLTEGKHCSVCGEVFVAQQTVSALGHEWSDWNSNQDGTHSRSCACNEVETKDCEWDDGAVTKKPTTTENGIRTYTCVTCGETKTEDIPMLGSDSAVMKGASVTIGKDLTMKYYVSLYDTSMIDDLAMKFTMNGKTVTVTEYTEEDGEYVFAFDGIPPQQMADLIDAELVVLDTDNNVVITLAEKKGYSLKAYAEALLTKYADNAPLVQLVTDMLTYGAEAQNYKQHNTDDLATDNVSGLGTASNAIPSKTDFNLTQNAEGSIGFAAAGVRFENVNKLYVKLSSVENAKIVVKKGNTTLGEYTSFETEDGSYILYTDAIYATEFATVYTFELYEGDTLVQTLTYSVNSYVYSMMGKTGTDGTTPTAMAKLAVALYRYGNSAEAYNNSLSEGPFDGTDDTYQ